MPAPDDRARRLLDVLLGPFRAHCLYAAAALGLPDRIGDDPVEPGELAHQLEVDADALRRLLRVLASLGVVERVGPATYRSGELGELLRTDGPESMRDLAICYGEQFYPPFRNVVSSVRSGKQSFPDVFGASLFDHYATDPEARRVFDGAMAAGSSFFRAVPHAVDFSEARRIVDVAGGDGSLLAEILATHPHLQGTLAELPRVTGAARDRLAERGVGHRCAVVGCDIFTEIPEGGDVYILSRVLHDWDDRSCRRLLRAVRAAMSPAARLVVIERLVPDDPVSPSLALDFDLHMLVNTGGRERDLAEYDSLFAAVGLRRSKIAALPLEVHAITSVLPDRRETSEKEAS